MRCALTSAIAAATAPSSVSSAAAGVPRSAEPASAAGVDEGGRPRGCDGSGYLRRRFAGAVAAVATRELEQPLQPGVAGDQVGSATLEEPAPLLRDGLRVLEVVLEQEPGVTGVESVDSRARSLGLL